MRLSCSVASFVVVLWANLALNAQERSIDFVYDVVQFRADDKHIRWELHYALADTTLTYARVNNEFVGELAFELTLSNPVSDTIRVQWAARSSATSQRPIHASFLTGMQALIVDPAQYTCSIAVRDLHDASRSATFSFVSVVRSLSAMPSVSDVLFVYPGSDPSVTRNSNHIRNGVAAIPNPRREVIGETATLGVYLEMYNTSEISSTPFTLSYDILDNVGREVAGEKFSYDRSHAWLADRTDLDVSHLVSGVYNLRTRLISSSGTVVTRKDRFFVLNPSKPPVQQEMLSDDQLFEASEWATCTGDRLQLELKLSEVIATPSERTVKSGLNTDRAQQRFLYRFWASRDPEPTTQINERLEEFRWAYERAQSAYARPGSSDGWKTDRGKVLLKYGRPTQVILSNATIDSKPYEEWFFQNMQGGVYFYFVDRFNNNSHQLVHSTLMGEINDPRWKERWARAGMREVNPASSGDGMPR